MPTNRINRITFVGQNFYTAALVVFGLQHLIYADFLTRLVPYYPASWVSTRNLAAYVFGLGLIGASAALIFRFQVRAVALVLAGVLFFSFLALHLPLAMTGPGWSGLWTNAGKCLALCGGALVLLGTSAEQSPKNAGFFSVGGWHRSAILLGRVFLGSFLILCGIQHFLWLNYVTPLVPRWMPGETIFWVYFTGLALAAGGLGIILPFVTKPASLMTAGMIFIWVFLLHLPRALSDLSNANEMTSLFEALAFSGIALVLGTTAGSRVGASKKKTARG